MSFKVSGTWEVTLADGDESELNEGNFFMQKFIASLIETESKIKGTYTILEPVRSIRLDEFTETYSKKYPWEDRQNFRSMLNADPNTLFVFSSGSTGTIIGERENHNIEFDILNEGPSIAKYVHKLGEDISLRKPVPIEFVGEFNNVTGEVSGRFYQLTDMSERAGCFIMRRVQDL